VKTEEEAEIVLMIWLHKKNGHVYLGSDTGEKRFWRVLQIMKP
jgi:hypothetical protein